MKLSMQFAAWFLLALEGSTVSSFSTVKVPVRETQSLLYSSSSSLFMSTTDDQKTEETSESSVIDNSDGLFIPVSFEEMVKQSSSAMEDAYAKGIARQTIRVLLPRSAENDQLLKLYEADADVDMSQAVLVPPDETWQGGIMQLYRAASISCQEILR
jgi:hypothetical protein